jgi:hypothetical protein
MKHAHFNLPPRDADTQHLLDNAFALWRRRHHGVAAIGCALVLTACGSGDDADAHPDRTTQPTDCGPNRERCL